VPSHFHPVSKTGYNDSVFIGLELYDMLAMEIKRLINFRRLAMKFVVLIGRIFYALIFILSSLGHFSSQTIMYGAKQGIPVASLLVPISGIIALLGGFCILLGYKARFGAWLIVIFLAIVTPMMHRFWGVSDPMLSSLQQTMFLKNLSMLGAALLIAYFGSGPFSLERHPHSQKKEA
jgi:putative oxidoreductase